MMGSAEFKVGLFVLACLAVVATMSLQVNNDPSISGRAQKHQVLVKDASGLVKNSNVKMAGIPIGIIKDIQLENGQAKILLNLRSKLDITKGASFEIRANGILGDKYLELIPGDPTAEKLPENSIIVDVKDRGSMDAILQQVSKIAADVGDVTKTLKAATTGDGDDSTPMGRIIHNIEDLTADLKDITGDNKDKINDTIDKVHNIASNIDQFIGVNGLRHSAPGRRRFRSPIFLGSCHPFDWYVGVEEYEVLQDQRKYT